MDEFALKSSDGNIPTRDGSGTRSASARVRLGVGVLQGGRGREQERMQGRRRHSYGAEGLGEEEAWEREEPCSTPVSLSLSLATGTATATVTTTTSTSYSPSPSPSPLPSTHTSPSTTRTRTPTMPAPPIHAIRLNRTTYLTPRRTLADDFRAWSFPVTTYPASHHNVHALRAMLRAEGIDEAAREAELLDLWMRECLKRWGFSSVAGPGAEYRLAGRVGAWLSEVEERAAGRAAREAWYDFGAVIGVGRESFRGAKEGRRGRRRGLGWARWFGWGEREERAWEEGDGGGDGDGETLPVYSVGEDPPAYER